MKKTSSKIRGEIARLQEQLRTAETREAERIGRLALRAGLGDAQVGDSEFVAAFEEVAARFRKGRGHGRKFAAAATPPGAPQGPSGEA